MCSGCGAESCRPGCIFLIETDTAQRRTSGRTSQIASWTRRRRAVSALHPGGRVDLLASLSLLHTSAGTGSPASCLLLAHAPCPSSGQAGIACILPGAGTRPAPLLVRWDSAARTDCADGRFGERLRRFLRRCGYSKPTTLCGNAGLPSSGSCQREVRTPRGRSNADMYHLNFCVRAI